MTASPVESAVHGYIVEHLLSGDGRGFDADTDLQQAGILDSFTMLALIAHLEERFGIQLEPVDVNPETFRSVRTIAALVSRVSEAGRQTA